MIAVDYAYHLDENLVLPSAAGVLAASSLIAGTVTDAEMQRLNMVGELADSEVAQRHFSCPESYRRDGSIGYVYVGDGLRVRDIRNKEILVLFDSAENHEGWSVVCMGPDFPIQKLTSREMVRLLRSSVLRGESRDVPYSDRAMRVLREELARRTSRRLGGGIEGEWGQEQPTRPRSSK